MSTDNQEPNANKKKSVPWTKSLPWKTSLGLLLFFVVSAVAIHDIEFASFWPGVTIGGYRKLKVGMTETEVEAILGSKGERVVDDGGFEDGPGIDLRRWHGARVNISVLFDENKLVRQVGASPKGGGPLGEAFLQKVRRWIGLVG